MKPEHPRAKILLERCATLADELALSDAAQARLRQRLWAHWIELDALDVGPEHRPVRQRRIATVSRVTGARVNQIVVESR